VRMVVGGRAVRRQGHHRNHGWPVGGDRGQRGERTKEEGGRCSRLEEDAIVRRERHNRERRKTRGGRGKTQEGRRRHGHAFFLSHDRSRDRGSFNVTNSDQVGRNTHLTQQKKLNLYRLFYHLELLLIQVRVWT
jgi:hypothetical protein